MSKTVDPDPADAIHVDAVVAKVHHLQDRVAPGIISSQCEYVIRPNHLAAVIEQLSHTGREAAWAVFMFRTAIPSLETTDDWLNLQYSIEQGVVGLDWVLLGPRNIADKKAITNFIRRRKHKVEAREVNKVAYLRVEDGDINGLGLGIVLDFYGVASDHEMGLLVQGFLPPPNLQLAQ